MLILLGQGSSILSPYFECYLLATFHRQALTNSPFAAFGLKRIVRDLLEMPGNLVFAGSQLKRIELLASHPHAKSLLICLKNYL